MIRGLHLPSRQQYLDFQAPRDVIEIESGLFDFVSFDIDKFFNLLLKSNPNCLERLRSPLVYLNRLPDFEILTRQIFSFYDSAVLFHHYLSLAKSNLDKVSLHENASYKIALYCLRGVVSAQVAASGELPALIFEDLINQAALDAPLKAFIDDCIEIKRSTKEKLKLQNREQVFDIIRGFYEKTAQMTLVKHGDRDKLQQCLTAYSIALKQQYYCG